MKRKWTPLQRGRMRSFLRKLTQKTNNRWKEGMAIGFYLVLDLAQDGAVDGSLLNGLIPYV